MGTPLGRAVSVGDVIRRPSERRPSSSAENPVARRGTRRGRAGRNGRDMASPAAAPGSAGAGSGAGSGAHRGTGTPVRRRAGARPARPPDGRRGLWPGGSATGAVGGAPSGNRLPEPFLVRRRIPLPRQAHGPDEAARLAPDTLRTARMTTDTAATRPAARGAQCSVPCLSHRTLLAESGGGTGPEPGDSTSAIQRNDAPCRRVAGPLSAACRSRGVPCPTVSRDNALPCADQHFRHAKADHVRATRARGRWIRVTSIPGSGERQTT